MYDTPTAQNAARRLRQNAGALVSVRKVCVRCGACVCVYVCVHGRMSKCRRAGSGRQQAGMVDPGEPMRRVGRER